MDEVTVRKFEPVSVELVSAVDAVKATAVDQFTLGAVGVFGVVCALAAGGAIAAATGAGRVFLGRTGPTSDLVGAAAGWVVTGVCASIIVGWWTATAGRILIRHQAGLRSITLHEAGRSAATHVTAMTRCWVPVAGVVAATLTVRHLTPAGYQPLTLVGGAATASYVLGRLALAAPLVSFTVRAMPVAWRLGGAWGVHATARGAVGVAMIGGPAAVAGGAGPAGWALGGLCGLLVGLPIWSGLAAAMLLDTLNPTKGQVDAATR